MCCTFCGRTPSAARDLVTRRQDGICVTCVADFLGYLAAPERVPEWERATAETVPCRFCGRWRWSSEVRFRRGGAVLCAACVASATRLLLRPRSIGVRYVPPGLERELRRGRDTLLRLHPAYELVFMRRRRLPDGDW